MEYATPRTTPVAWRDRILGMPLFYKVLVANTIIVLAGAVAGTTLTLQTAGKTDALFNLVSIFAFIGTLMSVVVNWVVLRAALRPLSVLEQTVDEVRRGNFNVRAQRVAFSDPSIDALADTFNRMLDAVERYRGQIHEMSVRVLNAQEEERKRIARELHDNTAQTLTAQLLRLKTIEATGGTLDPAGLAQLIEMTAETLEEVRHVAHELRPPSLDDLGLQASIESLAAQYLERFDIPVRLETDRVKRRFDPDVELAVYRIVQEALTNVAKHAVASEAVVTMHVKDEVLRVRVSDDGRGCNQAALNRDGAGLGLFGMRERATLVGGSLRFTSRINTGSVVDVVIPLDNPISDGRQEEIHA